jgi:ubiquinol-cytochrome c reductase cytochrome b subunit
VIVNLFSAIPLVGPDLAVWIRGDYAVSDATLNRFFAFHVIALPLALVGLVFVHIVALHDEHVGSNNPDGIEIKKKKGPDGKPLDGIPFHPYYTVKDIMGAVVFLMLFSAVLFFAPELGGYFLEHNNFIPADPLKTPEHIAPVWYFTPYYSILRATTTDFMWVVGAFTVVIAALVVFSRGSAARKAAAVAIAAILLLGYATLDPKFWGVVLMGVSVLIFALLPWLDKSPVKSIRYKGPIFKLALALFAVSFLILGYLGVLPPTPGRTLLAQVCAVIYFAFFALMPWYSSVDKTKPEPERVTG